MKLQKAIDEAITKAQWLKKRYNITSSPVEIEDLFAICQKSGIHVYDYSVGRPYLERQGYMKIADVSA